MNALVSGLGGRAAAIGLSVATHATLALAFAGGHAAPSVTTLTSGPAVVEVAVEVAPPDPPRELAPDPAPNRVAAPVPAMHAHSHPYPVPADHDAHPHDPSRVHAPVGPTPSEAPPAPAALTASEPAPPTRFALTVAPGSVSYGSASRVAPSSAAPSAPGPATDEAPLPAASVTVPARRVDAMLPAYPDAARRAGIEGDVAVEIVVDTRGAVVEARALRHAGYGLDEAAVAAARRWRFTPAQKDGRAVRVRMTCDVAFRFE